MNAEIIRKQMTGPGPFVIGTSDGRQFSVPHGEFIGFTRSYVMLEDAKGVLDIIDPLHVTSIRPVNKRRAKAV